MAKAKRNKTLRAAPVEWDWPPPRQRGRVIAIEGSEEPDSPLRLVIDPALPPTRHNERASSRRSGWLADAYFRLLIFLLKVFVGCVLALIAGVALTMLFAMISS